MGLGDHVGFLGSNPRPREPHAKQAPCGFQGKRFLWAPRKVFLWWLCLLLKCLRRKVWGSLREEAREPSEGPLGFRLWSSEFSP